MTVETYARKLAEFVEAKGVPPDRVHEVAVNQVWHESGCWLNWGEPCNCDVLVRFVWPPSEGGTGYRRYPKPALTPAEAKAAEAEMAR